MIYNFYIDPVSRKVNAENMVVLWKDQNVSTIHFTVEDFEGFSFDGASILIKAVLPDKTQVEITPENITIEPVVTIGDDGEEIITGYSTSFDWPLTMEHTRTVGTISYSICAIILNLDGETINKEWHTLNDSFQIRDHIHFNGSDDQDDPVTAATNAEKIAALKAQVDGLAGGVKTAGAVSQMTDQSVAYVYTGSETGYTRGNWYYWSGTSWVSGGTYGGAVTDPTLSVAGAPADAKAVGDVMAGIGAASVPTEVRQAIKTLFDKAAYIEAGLADEVAVITAWAEATTGITVSPATASVSSTSTTAQLSAVTTPAGKAVTWASSNTAVATVSSAGLVTAVGNGTTIITATSGTVSASCAVTVTGFATLTGITAVYSGGSVTDSATLDDLKFDLVVTASYDDSTTEAVTDYALSGTLSVGTSTITVSYGGFTDSFTVTVTTDLLYKWDLTKSLTDEVAGQVAVASAGSGVDAPAITGSGIVFNAATQMLSLGNINLTGKTIEIDVAAMDFKGSTSAHVRFLSNMLVNGSVGTGPIVYRKSTGWSAYVKTTGSSPGWTNRWTSTQDISLFNGKTVKLVSGSDGTELYLDGELLGSLPKFVYEYGNNTQNVCIAGLPSYDQSSGDQCYDMVISGIRIKDAEDAEVSE